MRNISCLLFCLCIAFAADSIASAQTSTWRPVTQGELDQKTPKVEPDADAEAIFWEVRLDDKGGKLSYQHYVRVKIFTERGRERFSKVDIPFIKGKKVEDVAARVTRPDGTFVELKPGDIFEREVAKAGKAKVMAKSFAVPAIEPGVIVEYQYREVIKNDNAGGERLIFQRDIPMQKVSYYVRPYGRFTLRFTPYNMDETRFVDAPDGFKVGTMTDVPAYKEEPYMPPDDEVRKWVYLSYVTFGSIFQWPNMSIGWQYGLKKLAKPTKEIKAKAAELTDGAATDEEKVRRIYDFVQKRMKNIAFESDMTDEEFADLDMDNAKDVLRNGIGTSMQLDLVFAALTKAAGFETNVILGGDRAENFFDPTRYPIASFIQMSGVAVKIGTEWKYFDPCAPYMPFGTLAWNRENVSSMLVGEGGYIWRTTPLVDQSVSVAKRSGTFTLDADGTLDGEIRLEYAGHQGISRRHEQIRDSNTKREENIKDEIRKKISTAEVTAITIDHFGDSQQPLTYIAKVRVPGYAQKAGKRLILQPGFFEFGSTPAFSASARTNDIYFQYPWSEQDKVEIKLPDGYELESPDAPGEIRDTSKISSLKVTMTINQSARLLRYTRDFYFGGGGKIFFPVASYKAIKSLFDQFHRADTHAVALRAK